MDQNMQNSLPKEMKNQFNMVSWNDLDNDTDVKANNIIYQNP